jgi:hypothetical protein
MFIFEYYLPSESFSALREAFSNAYPDNEAPNKITINRLAIKFRDTGTVCDRIHIRCWEVLTGKMLSNTEGTLKEQLVFLVIMMSLKLTNTGVVNVAF